MAPRSWRARCDVDITVKLLSGFHVQAIQVLSELTGRSVNSFNDAIVDLKKLNKPVPSKLANKLRRFDLSYKGARHLNSAMLEDAVAELRLLLPGKTSGRDIMVKSQDSVPSPGVALSFEEQADQKSPDPLQRTLIEVFMKQTELRKKDEQRIVEMQQADQNLQHLLLMTSQSFERMRMDRYDFNVGFGAKLMDDPVSEKTAPMGSASNDGHGVVKDAMDELRVNDIVAVNGVEGRIIRVGYGSYDRKVRVVWNDEDAGDYRAGRWVSNRDVVKLGGQ